VAGREGVLVDEGEAVSAGHFLQFTEAEAQQDALFDPGVDRPVFAGFFGGTDFAAGETGTEV
jgi:hypothetical protein